MGPHQAHPPGWQTLLKTTQKLTPTTLRSCKNINQSDIKKIILGILSADHELDLRNAQRRTWLSECFFNYLFLLDKETEILKTEQQTFQDIFFLNATHSGPENHFGQKIFLWIEHAHKNYPEAELIGKLDNDLYADSENLYKRLSKISDPLLYYGWGHPYPVQNTRNNSHGLHFLGEAGQLNNIDSTRTTAAKCRGGTAR